MNILVCQTNPKNVLQIEIKDLTFEVPISPLTFFFLKFVPIGDHTFMTCTWTVRGGL